MVRKIANIIFSLILLISTTGFVVSEHYCSGELISVSINSEAKSCCDMGSCCHNENEYFQLDENYVSPVIIQDITISEIDILFPIIFAYQSTEIFQELLVEIIPPDPFPPPDKQIVLSNLQTYLL